MEMMMTIEKFDREKARAHLKHEEAVVITKTGTVSDVYIYGDEIIIDEWDEMRIAYLTDTPPEPSAFYDEAAEITPEQWAAMSDFFDRRKRAAKATPPIKDSGYTDVADLPDRTMLSSTPGLEEQTTPVGLDLPATGGAEEIEVHVTPVSDPIIQDILHRLTALEQTVNGEK